jgi:hypothetical protein
MKEVIPLATTIRANKLILIFECNMDNDCIEYKYIHLSRETGLTAWMSEKDSHQKWRENAHRSPLVLRSVRSTALSL